MLKSQIFIDTYLSPVGKLVLATRDAFSLTGLWIDGQKYFCAGLDMGNTVCQNNIPVFNATKRWLDAYFAGHPGNIYDLNLSPTGGEFRQSVWRALCDIPYGTTATYGDIAQMVSVCTGRATSPRAVGGAIGHNPISIIIPCHRVVGANGNLVGYAGGLDIKKKLLMAEGVNL